MAGWHIIIDQQASGGGLQRYEHDYESSINSSLLCDAVEDALDRHGLIHVSEGQYQITTTRAIPDG